MASSFLPSSLSLPPSTLSPPRTIRTLAYSLPSPKPRTRRKNHLRPKLPKPQITNPPNPSLPPLPPPSPPAETLASHFLVLESEASVEEMVRQSESVGQFPSAAHRWLSSPVLDLSLRFAALLAVQTVVAVLILGGGRVEERIDGGPQEEEEEVVVNKEEELSEFERMVFEIREMAKEARESEAKELADGNGDSLRKSILEGFMDEKAAAVKELGGNGDGGKLGPRRRRLGFLKSKAKSQKVPKGFDGSKSSNKGSKGIVNGGIQQISPQKPVEEFLELDAPIESSAVNSRLIKKFAGVEDLTISPFEKSADVSNVHTSTQRIERLGSGNSTSNPSENYMQAEDSVDLLSAENSAVQQEAQTEQSFVKENHLSSTELNNINGNSSSASRSKEAQHKPTVKKDKYSTCDTCNKSWWLKLPFVLAIFLRRGSGRSAPQGLYSLKMDSPSDDGGSASCTIAFEDRGDATNFCYLLESFFEDLGDFSADTVPLTIHELEEVVQSTALKVIVVRKGQLRLYAGQPLAEVEVALRSMLDHE